MKRKAHLFILTEGLTKRSTPGLTQILHKGILPGLQTLLSSSREIMQMRAKWKWKRMGNTSRYTLCLDCLATIDYKWCTL